MKSWTDFSVAALAKTPKDRALEANPGRFGDCKENPRCKKADLEGPSEDLIEVTKEAIVVRFGWIFKPGTDEQEKGKEAMWYYCLISGFWELVRVSREMEAYVCGLIACELELEVGTRCWGFWGEVCGGGECSTSLPFVCLLDFLTWMSLLSESWPWIWKINPHIQ